MRPFTLICEGLPPDARLMELDGQEAVNELYAFSMTVRFTPVAGLAELEDRLLGARASLRLGSLDYTRHGILTSVELIRGLDGGAVELAATLEPRHSLLQWNTQSRIFQDQTVVEVAQTLVEQGRLPVELRLEGTYPSRAYITQHEQTDLSFLRRLLAEEGIAFDFEHDGPDADDPSERMILFDHSEASPRLGTLPFIQSPFIQSSEAADAGGGLDGVYRFGRRRRLQTQRVLRTDFDFRHPNLPLQAAAEASDPDAIDTSGDLMRRHTHAPRAEVEGAPDDAAVEEARTGRWLEQHRRGSRRAEGACRRPLVRLGARFTLEGHSLPHLDGGYLVTWIEHRFIDGDAGGADVGYHQQFRCIPETVVPRPPPLERRSVRGTETATVVG
ncbi:MAG: contractile injection system protein, VgrG/Pvc8 family, partial [Myxococcota bacterium]